ncbi:intronic ORF at intron 2 of large subunit ribosomal RNA protein, partial [Tuber indicum]
VTGLIDAEGCFIIAILPSTGPNKKKISLRLSVTQKLHSVGILYDLNNFFGCGQVITSSKDCMRFVVQRKEDILNKIIPHFTNFPLVTSKELNFETLKEAAMIVARGEHLNPIGLEKIISLKALMNKNRSFEELFNHFKNKTIKLNPYWVQAFIEGEGCFSTLLTKSDKTNKISIRNRLSISQSTHDFAVLKAIKEFFNAGYLNPKAEDINSLDLAKLSQDNSFYYNSMPETFIPFFDKYPLYSRKQLDYQDFLKFYQLKKNKAHLTDTGFKIMDNLCRNMNSGRDNIEKSRRK